MMSVRLSSIVLLVASCLSACSSGLQRLTLETHTAHYLNPDTAGRTSPVLLTVYDLRSSIGFNQTSYQQLQANSNAEFNNNVIDRQSYELRPDQMRELQQYLPPNTRYIGLVAAFRNIDQAKWRQLIPINTTERMLKLLVFIETQSIIAKKVSHHDIL